MNTADYFAASAIDALTKKALAILEDRNGDLERAHQLLGKAIEILKEYRRQYG